MNLFDTEYFPTPVGVVRKMIEPYVLQREVGWNNREILKLPGDGIVLEPSAGSGNILDVLTDSFSIDKRNMYSIEQNPDLTLILQGKGYRVIGSDFLDYRGDYAFDLILMNPPFSNGDEHLLKAWDVLESGEIVCLLNEETIKNPYSQMRKQLNAIIDAYGGVEYLGDCFNNSDRKTGVNVAMVRLKKTSNKKRFDFDFTARTNEPEIDFSEAVSGNGVALNDIVGNWIRTYEKTKEAFVNYMKAREALVFYSGGLLDSNRSITTIADNAIKEKGSKPEQYNNFVDEIKLQAWMNIIGKMKIDAFFTNGVKNNFAKFTQTQGAYDLTKENIFDLVNMLVHNRHSIMSEAIVDVFDTFTKHHKENRFQLEGWKTNDYWKVNKKVILPNWVSWGSYMTASQKSEWGDTFKMNSSYRSEYDDIDKVMCYLTGRKLADITTIHTALNRAFDRLGKVASGSFIATCESTYFTMRFFKKGTLHIEFKDSDLWAKFNIEACKGKKWLGN